MDNRWAMQLTSDERNWVWGLIGEANGGPHGHRPANDALRYFAKV
jgi:soluble lytic murein transglycosylase